MTTSTFEVQDDGTVEFETNTTVVYTFETAPPQGIPGVGVSNKITKLSITASKNSGSTYSVTSDGTGYTQSGDDGNIKTTNTLFLEDCSVTFFLNGIFLIKGVSVIWVSQTSFTLQHQVDNGDEILILS